MSTWGNIRSKFKSIFSSSESGPELSDEYVELEANIAENTAKVLVRPFTLTQFDDIRSVLAAIRDGSTIAILNIGPLKEKDISELKRAVDKIKKTVDANNGDIAGFGENFLVLTPSFAKVQRNAPSAPSVPSEPSIDSE